MLDDLKGDVRIYTAVDQDDDGHPGKGATSRSFFDAMEEDNKINPREFKCKKSAILQLPKNILFNQRWVNGRRCRVLLIGNNHITVFFRSSIISALVALSGK